MDGECLDSDSCDHLAAPLSTAAIGGDHTGKCMPVPLVRCSNGPHLGGRETIRRPMRVPVMELVAEAVPVAARAETFEAFYRAQADRLYPALALAPGHDDLAREATDEAMTRAYDPRFRHGQGVHRAAATHQHPHVDLGRDRPGLD